MIAPKWVSVDACTLRDSGEPTSVRLRSKWCSVEERNSYDALPGPAREWAELWRPCETEPLALGLAAVAAASTALGRNVQIGYGNRQLCPLQWVACVGETGRTRKEAIAAAAEHLLRRVAPGVAVRRDVSSGEALVEALSRAPHTLILLRELGLLTDRARSRETRLFGTKLVEAYDMPERLELCRVSRRDGDGGLTIAEKPTVGLIAVGTPGDLLPVGDLARRGLVSRLLIFPLRAQPLVPLPGGPTVLDLDRVAHKIADRLAQARDRGTIPMSDATVRFWSDSCQGMYAHLRRSLDDLDVIRRACVERVEVHVLRMAAMTAILDGRGEIEPDDCDRASLVVNEAVERLLALLAAGQEVGDASVRQRVMLRIRSALLRHGAQKRRDLERRVCDRTVGAQQFAGALEALLGGSEVSVDEDGTYAFRFSGRE